MASDLLERLEQRAAPTVAEPRRGLTYNFPLAWYRRPDGDIVQLQSDPNNRTYYEDLGFVMLRSPEVNEWLSEVRPALVREQRRRASLITAIRKIEVTSPQFVIDDDDQLSFGSMPLDELEQYYKDACEQTGRKPRMPKVREDSARDAANDARLSGVETSDNMSMEELHAKKERGSTIQGQGYDPLREARRR